ncbi:hypothetical protein G9A89_000099 [Geosiphon pyriformis]|nr:hypothetical protein G9A89_000099 [Geosiphon pyriformis]
MKYCEENYSVKQKFSFGFESETEEEKRKRKQKLRITPNIPKTTAKHLQTPEQGTSFKLPLLITPFPALLAQLQTPSSPLIQFSRIKDFQSPKSPIQQQEPILTSTNLIDYLAKNRSKKTESEQETEDSENKEEIASTYIAKSLNLQKKTVKPVLKNGLTKSQKQKMQMNSSLTITLPSPFEIETNEYYSNAQILDQFIAGLKDKLIKKVCPHAPEDLATAIQQVKNYEMAIEEANCTKLVNLAIGETSSTAEEKIDQLTKKVENYFTNQQQQQQLQRYQPLQRQNQNNFTLLSNNQPQNCHYSTMKDQQNRSNQCYPPLQQSYYQSPPPAYYPPRPQYQSNYYQPTPQPTQQQYQQPPTQHYQVPAQRLIPQNQINLNNQLVFRNSAQPRPNYYHTQPSYLTMPKEQDFHYTALSESRAAAQQQNLSYTPTTIPPARIAENANLSDIFSFEFEANESPFLLSNAVANEQKAITAMYTEAEAKGKPICLILDIQTIIVIADGIKKTPVGEINNFLFTIDGITIPVKVLVMDAPQYQALVGNDWLQKANANLNWKTQELTIFYQGQHVQVPATCGTFNKHSEKAPAFEFEPEEEKPIIETFMALKSTSNWADETEQQYFLTNNSLETKKPVTPK